MSNPTGFSPSTIASNLGLWLDASQSNSITTSGTSVTQWLDRSGNNFACISNILGNPLPNYSNVSPYRYVQFTDNQSMYVNSWGYTTGWTCFVCMNTVSLSARWLISPYNDVDLVMMGMNVGSNKVFPNLLPSAGSDVTGNHIENTSASNTGTTAPLYWYRDGTLQTSNNTNAARGANGTARLGIGTNASFNDARAGTYNIYEIIIYKTLITDTQRQQVEGYLAWKWGMTANLPSTHPYKNNPFIATLAPIITIPTNAYIVPVNTYSTIKTFNLPVVSTNPGRMIILKDYLGYAGSNNIYLSTQGLDRIERNSISSMALSNAFGAWTFMNDGITNWFLMDAYRNSLFIKSVGFDPKSISGLSLWFDPSDSTTLYQNSSLTSPITADGQTVSGMADKSGNNYYATSTNGPTYKTNIVNGKSILRFNGSQWINNVSYPFPNTAYSIFAIGYLTTFYSGGGGYQRLLQAYPDGILFLGTLNSVVATFTGTGGWQGGVAANSASYNWLGSWYLVQMHLTGSTLYPFVTGNAQSAKGSSSTGSFTNLNIGGANGAYSGQPWYGDIGEILVYNSYLADVDRQKIEGYLAWKWGIQGQLPSGHPYKNASP